MIVNIKGEVSPLLNFFKNFVSCNKPYTIGYVFCTFEGRKKGVGGDYLYLLKNFFLVCPKTPVEGLYYTVLNKNLTLPVTDRRKVSCLVRRLNPKSTRKLYGTSMYGVSIKDGKCRTRKTEVSELTI